MEGPYMGLGALAAVVFCATFFAQPLLIRHLRRVGRLDHPNERSSHVMPTPRGAGIGALFAVSLGVLVTRESPYWWLVTLAVPLGLLGWVDDIRALAPGTRLMGQFIVGVVAGLLIATAAVAEPEAAVVAVILLALFVVVYVNTFNFMDGIDGVAGFNAGLAGVVFLTVGLGAGNWTVAMLGVTIAAAAAGFLPFNLRGRIFLGDVGSYLFGALISLTVGYGIAAGLSVVLLMSPLIIYVSDTLFTLSVRVARREAVLHAHRSHVYQRLSAVGLSHLWISAWVTACGALEVVSATVYLTLSPPAGALMSVTVVLVYLSSPRWLRSVISSQRSMFPSGASRSG